MEEMGAAYMANGLITLAGSRMYTSMADTDAVIDEALNKFEIVLSSVEGLNWQKSAGVVRGQRRFH
jgi:glutamate-1-semialdehyde 2,1-aminomutase